MGTCLTMVISLAGAFLDIGPFISLDSPFLDFSVLDDFVSILRSINPVIYMFFFLFYSVDATAESGRLGRLLNHSKSQANCTTRVVPIKDRPYLIIVAARDIQVSGKYALCGYKWGNVVKWVNNLTSASQGWGQCNRCDKNVIEK